MSAPTVLITDDDLHLTHILEYKLREAGLEVVAVNNSQSAYELACTQPPDLVITDFWMPHLDGCELCTMLKQNPDTSDIPVIMLTARGQQLRPSLIQQTNVRRLMAKPFSSQELIEAVKELLGTRFNQDD